MCVGIDFWADLRKASRECSHRQAMAQNEILDGDTEMALTNVAVSPVGNRMYSTDSNPANVSFEERLMLTRMRIFNLAHRMLGNRDDAEDVTQETLSRAWAHSADRNSHSSLEGWVYRIAVNLCLDRKRRQKRLSIVSLDAFMEVGTSCEGGTMPIADVSNDPARRLMAEQIDDRLILGVKTLPRCCRAAVKLWMEEHTYEEMAAIMKCPVGTVRSRLFRARAHVSAAMQR